MSPDVDDTHIEERIRAALNDVAARVTFAGDLELEAAPDEHGRPARTLAVAGIAAACVVALAAGVGLAVHHNSSRSPAASLATTSTTAEPSPTSPPTTEDPVAAAALAAWAKFPVRAVPRPLLLLEGSVNAPATGFTDPDIRVADNDKDAFDAGAILSPRSFPSGPPNAGGYPIISAETALARLRQSGSGTASTFLTTTNVELGTGSFLTDRGPMTLPAWLISFRGVTDPAEVLAVDPAALFTAPDPAAFASITASSIPGSNTLTLTFTGAAAGTGPCSADYAAHVTESTVAVAVSIEETPRASTGVNCLAIGYSREVTISLTEPLGARVLVDEKTRAAIEVAP